MRKVVFDVMGLVVGLSGMIALVIIMVLLAIASFGLGYCLGYMI